MLINKIFFGLPAFNEEESINSLFNKIYLFKKSLGLDLEIIFYDDGSTDKTKAAVDLWTDKMCIHYLNNNVNNGLGTAINVLISHFIKNATNNDILIIMDCDNTHNPEQTRQMISALQNNKNTDVIIASRYRKGSYIQGLSYFRIVLSIFAALLYKLIHPIPHVRDYTCGYRLYTYDIIFKLHNHYSSPILKEKNFACMVELILKLKKLNANMREIPLLLRYDQKKSASKMNISENAIRLLKKLLVWKIRGLQ